MTDDQLRPITTRSAWWAGWRNGFLLGILGVAVGMGILARCSHG